MHKMSMRSSRAIIRDLAATGMTAASEVEDLPYSLNRILPSYRLKIVIEARILGPGYFSNFVLAIYLLNRDESSDDSRRRCRKCYPPKVFMRQCLQHNSR
jgi:hypothetical protein